MIQFAMVWDQFGEGTPDKKMPKITGAMYMHYGGFVINSAEIVQEIYLNYSNVLDKDPMM
jgi:hypothetical protein